MKQKIEFKGDVFSIGENVLDKGQLFRYYITENKSILELGELLGLSRSSVERIVRHYGLHKTKLQAEEIAKKTCQEKYGTDFYSQTKEYKKTTRENSLQKYGCDHSSQAASAKEAYRDTCLKKYGVTTTAILPENIEKRKKTNLKKYGVENYAQTKECHEKIRDTCLDRYGFDSFSKTDSFQEKKRDTCLQRYGVDSFSKTSAYKEKVKKTNLLKYGSLSFQQKEIPRESVEIVSSKEKFLNFLREQPNKMTSYEIGEKLGYNFNSINAKIELFHLQKYVSQKRNFSKPEKELKNFLMGLGIKTRKTRKELGGLEIDLYSPQYKIGIEFNGTYWHSDLFLEKNYHFNKSKLAEEKGIRLIHIYEYEWNDSRKRPIIESLLKIAFGKISEKIYARKCEVREISNSEAKIFNNANHLQGHRNAQVTLGLYYDNILVQLMSFSKTKYNKNLTGDNSWEIIRGCPGSNNLVVGGVSKLFAYFVKKYEPDKVFSYCDFNKFDGHGYEALGMDFIGYTGPDMKWIIGHEVVGRQPKRHEELKEKASGKIWGSGSKKYCWKKVCNLL